MKFAVIGHPINHSLSPAMHMSNFKSLNRDDYYMALNIPNENFHRIREIIFENKLDGFNVTIPYKEAIIPYLDEISESAQNIGAVNTVLVKDNKWIGYNTDGLGFVKGLIEKHGPIENKNILILGAGGASKGIAFELLKHTQQKISVANRTMKRFNSWKFDIKKYTLEEITSHLKTFDIIINTTSVGLNNTSDDLIIPIESIRKSTLVCDIIYIPEKTPFLSASEQNGNVIYNGLDMFIYQGAESFKIWTNKNANVEKMKNEVQKNLKRS